MCRPSCRQRVVPAKPDLHDAHNVYNADGPSSDNFQNALVDSRPFVCRVNGNYTAAGKSHQVGNSTIVVQPLERTGEVSVSVGTTPKADNGLAGDSAGDTVDFIILLNNTGTTTLSNITVTSTQLLAQFERYFMLCFSSHCSRHLPWAN